MSIYKKFRSNNICLLSFILVILITNFLILYCFTFKVEIVLKGNKNIILKYPEEFVDDGYFAKFFNKDISSRVKVTGKVDSKKVGRYEIIYSIKYGIFTSSKKRVVKIVDDMEPNLTLLGESEVFVCKGKKYIEDGFEASDNYDGVLTDKVIVNESDEKIVYTIRDSSDNEVSAVRYITYKDVNSPTINLSGNKTVRLNIGSKYVEPGFTASDNCDGDLTNKVQVSGNVDTNTVGTYTITYTVVDSSKNKTSATREVIVDNLTNKASMNVGIPGVIYLTFDDGPGAGTEKILNILRDEGVKATFFVTCSGKDDLLIRAYNEGHTVALHTASHNYKYVYSSLDNYYADLNRVSERVRNLTGYDSKIIRFPGGSSNTISRGINRGIMSIITNDTLAKGYHYFDWNVDSNDAGSCAKVRTSSCVYNSVVKGLSKSRSNVVLMHDIKTYTADALKDIIRYGKNNGYTFEAITMDTAMVKHSVNN